MTATSFNTKLNDRVLWYDGDSSVSENYVTKALKQGKVINGLFVDEITPNIKQYNKLVPYEQELKLKTNLVAPNLDFDIPEEYISMDIDKFITNKVISEFENNTFSNVECKIRIERIKLELSLYEKYNLLPVLKTLIFVINTLQYKNIVWGVGRGSCVASYVLYLLGVHDVDSVKYDIDIQEFLHPQT